MSSQPATSTRSSQLVIMRQTSSVSSGGQVDTDSDGTTELGQELAFMLNECFYLNLNWCDAQAFLDARTVDEHRQLLGLRTAKSDVAWRYFKKLEMEKIQLRKIYERRMQTIQVTLEKILSEGSVYQTHQKSIDEIFAILRSKDNVSNPMTGMMGRNFSYFAKLKLEIRKEL
jgi:hypothetical protein